MTKSVLILSAGGTIFQKFHTAHGRMELSVAMDEILEPMKREFGDMTWEMQRVAERSGAYLTFEILFHIRNTVRKCIQSKYTTDCIGLLGR
jgi:hypothetical protein